MVLASLMGFSAMAIADADDLNATVSRQKYINWIIKERKEPQV